MTAEHSNPAAHRSPWKDPWVWGVLALALGLRLLYLTDLRHTPFFAHPQMDALYHDQWARRLAAGDWWGKEVFFRAPLYPYFLGVVYAVFGPHYLLVRVIQFAVGAGTALLTSVFAYPRFGRFAAVTAGLLVALHGPLIYFEGELLLVVLEAPLFLLTAWSLDRALSRGTVRSWIGAGVVAGTAALVRPTVLAVVPVVAVYLLVRHRGRGLRPAFLYAGIVLLTLSPVLIRNYAVGRDVVPVASQGGLNFFLGNNPDADGMAAIAPEFRRTWEGQIHDSTRAAELAVGRPLKPSQVSRYWYRRAAAWAIHDPGAFLKLDLLKLGYFWDAFEIPNNQDYYFFSRMSRIFRTPFLSGFGILCPLALAGLALGLLRRRLPFAWVAVPAVLAAVIVAFFVCGRYLTPLLAIWGGYGLADAVTGIRSGHRRRFLAYGAVLIVFSWAVNADLFHHRLQHSYAESYLRLAVFYSKAGDTAEAFAAAKSSVMVEPGFADGWNNLGVLEAQRGTLAAARQDFTTAILLDPAHPKALGNLAALACQEGRRVEADSLARRTLAAADHAPKALMDAGVVLGNLGRLSEALVAFRRVVELEPANAAARLGEARALTALGRRDDARSALERVPPASRTPGMVSLLKELSAP
jgi:Flp pilus assembly protein TadD/4-amino-4-deoxy-L-arabinose transferase-like glycosyltransferase